ncbi:FAD-dependent oxidoreductase [Roseospira goensis]|uniref:Ferredoxin--NADP+ reductase n=1 Tax=Roseospira goensis TaxID=391922 RepID=A0A7W6WLM6_9PROT|nr:FAD-dependent oxidoreductase [Roseospira goensis]MBB4286888.1 ferredoxin--NADP+ reductase [Roseospira goensis]
MTTPSPATVCIVGAGPAGLYAADALIRKRPDARIDMLDRLPTPFGLVRAGVAPDHQGTKAIVRQFARTLGRPGVRFLGHVAVGRDVTLAELRDAYDAVILATGAPEDRRLGIPGEDLAGVYGSGAFVGWYNGHPDHAGLAPRLTGPGVAVVGNGNVALDIARVLAKTPAEMTGADLTADAARTIAAAPLTDIHILGRRGPLEASFTPAELAEMGTLTRAVPVVDPAALPDAAGAWDDPKEQALKDKTLEILRGLAARPAASAAPVRVHFHFRVAPLAVLGADGAVTGLRLARTRVEDGRAVVTEETTDLPVATVVSAIGYRCAALAGAPLDDRGVVANTDGTVAPGLFVVGWSKRGPSGVIPTNRADSMAVAGRVLAWLDAQAAGKPGPDALDRLLVARGVRAVSREDWDRLDAAEVARGAAAGRPREKFTSVAAMLAALDAAPGAPDTAATQTADA